MKNNRKIIIAIISTVLVILLAACENSSNETTANLEKESTNRDSTQHGTDDSSNKVDEDTDENKLENTQEDTDETWTNDQDQEDVSENPSTNLNVGDSVESSNNDSELTESNKEEYLKKLNKMEESDRYSDAGTTMIELEEEEAKRYNKWDEELNEIYGMLEKQLSTEQMDELREEQRKWVIQRDELAKESSLKYKGGTTESLEYIATQASLTRERCYELVAKYMN